jgi:hypothetical protein
MEQGLNSPLGIVRRTRVQSRRLLLQSLEERREHGMVESIAVRIGGAAEAQVERQHFCLSSPGGLEHPREPQPAESRSRDRK